MARAPVPGRCKTRLEPLLGPEGCAALQEVLLRRTLGWAAAVAPGSVLVALDGAWEIDGFDVVAQAGAHLGERLSAAVEEAFSRFGGPLLVVGTDCPRLDLRHAAAGLADIADGADASFGPAMDGGYYLVAMREPRADLFALPREEWGGETVLARTLALAARSQLEVGMLRMERDLDTPADARAFLADPLTPLEIRAALAP